MAQLVTIFGGSGFVGRYIARRMAQQGYRVRVAVRRRTRPGLYAPMVSSVRSSPFCATSAMMPVLQQQLRVQMQL